MDNHISQGNVYVMTHSFFSDVIRIGCTPENPPDYAKKFQLTHQVNILSFSHWHALIPVMYKNK